MKANRPCSKFQASQDNPSACFWCKWDEVPHVIPDDAAFESSYWETLFGSGSSSGSVTDYDQT